MARALLLNPADHVAVLVDCAAAGDRVDIVNGQGVAQVTVAASLGVGQKIAVADAATGARLRKYGEVIGELTSAVRAGDHVHVHNLVSLRGR